MTLSIKRENLGFYFLIAVLILIIGLFVFYVFTTGEFFGLPLVLRRPPGCATSSMGGCFGNNLNKNFRVSGELPSCLHITNQECQSAQIKVENLCSAETHVEIQSIPITKNYTYLVFTKDANGNIVRETYGYPKQEQSISVQGVADGKPFTISYIRTPALCE